MPCNYVHTKLGYTGDSVSEDCIADLETQQNFLGSIEFLLYINQSTFDQQGFNEDTIIKKSIILSQQSNAQIPSFIDYSIKAGRVID